MANSLTGYVNVADSLTTYMSLLTVCDLGQRAARDLDAQRSASVRHRIVSGKNKKESPIFTLSQK